MSRNTLPEGIVFIATSLDGFIAREDGDIEWLTSRGSSDEDYGYYDFSDSIDVLVMGRNSFEKVLTFDTWPYGDKPVIVLSSRPLSVPEALKSKVEVRSLEPLQLMESLSSSGVRRVYVDGGITIQRFLRAGLIDEMIITTIPVLIGSGIPLFGALEEDVSLTHVETKAYPDGLVQSRYRVVK